jgi:hypothetical protein
VALNKAAYTMGGYVAANRLTYQTVYTALYEAIEKNGLLEKKGDAAHRTLVDGLDDGMAVPLYAPKAKTPPPTQDNKPYIILNGKQLNELTDEAAAVIAGANQATPQLFLHQQLLTKIETDEEGRPIVKVLETPHIKRELNRVADFFLAKKESDEYTPAHPTHDLATQLLALLHREWKLPHLAGLVDTPVLRPDGSILRTPGYDTATRLYYVPGCGLERLAVPDAPTKEDAKAAMERILDVFVDFPFEGDADKANTIALLFTPFVKPFIKGDIQMAGMASEEHRNENVR